MSLNSHYQKLKYLDALRELVAELYSIRDSEAPKYKTKGGEFHGFAKAGVILGVATKE